MKSIVPACHVSTIDLSYPCTYSDCMACDCFIGMTWSQSIDSPIAFHRPVPSLIQPDPVCIKPAILGISGYNVNCCGFSNFLYRTRIRTLGCYHQFNAKAIRSCLMAVRKDYPPNLHQPCDTPSPLLRPIHVAVHLTWTMQRLICQFHLVIIRILNLVRMDWGRFSKMSCRVIPVTFHLLCLVVLHDTLCRYILLQHLICPFWPWSFWIILCYSPGLHSALTRVHFCHWSTELSEDYMDYDWGIHIHVSSFAHAHDHWPFELFLWLAWDREESSLWSGFTITQ